MVSQIQFKMDNPLMNCSNPKSELDILRILDSQSKAIHLLAKQREELEVKISQKADVSSLSKLASKIDNRPNLIDIQASLEQKISYEEFSKLLEQDKSECYEKLAKLESSQRELFSSLTNLKNEFVLIEKEGRYSATPQSVPQINSIANSLHKKADIELIEETKNSIQNDLENKLNCAYRHIRRTRDELLNLINKNARDIPRKLRSKRTISCENENFTSSKAKNCVPARKHMLADSSNNSAGDSNTQLQTRPESWKENASEISEKPNFQSKTEFTKEIENFISGLLPKPICCSKNLPLLHTEGRWLCKHGVVGKSLSWDVQVLNTDASFFEWTSSFITVRVPGLYELSGAFYSPETPEVAVLVNSVPILRCSTSKTRLQTPEIISGLSVLEFLALPTQAKISVEYLGDYRIEGFIGLKKL